MGLNLDQVLANAIDHDTHLSASLSSPPEHEVPNFKQVLNSLQLQVERLVEQPELPADERQRVLQTALLDLQQAQILLS